MPLLYEQGAKRIANILDKSSRVPIAFRRWVLLNEEPGSRPVLRRVRSAALYEQGAKRIANIFDIQRGFFCDISDKTEK